MKQSYLQIKTGLPISSLVSSEDVTSLTALLSNFLYFPHVTGLGGQVGALFKLFTAASTLFPTPYPLNTHTHTHLKMYVHHNMEVKNMSQTHRLKSQHHHLLALGPWASHLASFAPVSLSVKVAKMVPILWCYED